MASASDNFNRGDGVVVDPPWVSQNGFPGQVLSQRYQGIGASTQSPVFWNTSTTTFSADHYAQITVITVAAATDFVYAQVRCSGTGAGTNAYVLRTDGTTTIIRKVISNVTTLLLDCGTGAVSGDILKLLIVGNTLTAYKNGIVIGTVASGGELTTGQPGMSIFNNAILDDWSAADNEQPFLSSPVSINPRPNAFRSGF